MKTIFWLSCFLLLNLQLSAQSDKERGDIAYYARDYHPARLYYERALNEHPKDLDLLSKLADCSRVIGDFISASEYYSTIIQNPKSSLIDHYWYADALKSLGLYKAAKKVFKTIKKQSPKSFRQALPSCRFAIRKLKCKGVYTVAAEDSINDLKYDDYAPTFYLDNTIFSSSRKTKDPMFGYSSPHVTNFLYTTTSDNKGGLNKPILLEDDLLITNIAPIAIRIDKKILCLSYNKFKQGERHISGAALSKLLFETIQIESDTNIDLSAQGDLLAFAQDISYGFPAFSPDGQVLYFAAEQMEGITHYGGMDIYTTTFEDSVWTLPKNLGPTINTTGDEICPFVDENNILYFTSDFHKGFGGYDIHKSIPNKKKGTWGKVKNLGSKVNSPRDDLYFIFDSNKGIGYFSSDRKGNLDIYRATLNKK
ncbi:MAG: hypothetical protein GY810_30755 [Aureispira sp.]|nr:hypothetical protein [Aureispira sp.]